jgi:hypothetical protein
VAADGNLVQLAEDFEDVSPKALWQGQPLLSADHAFSGRRSLLVNSASRDVSFSVSVPHKAKTGYRATIHFFDPRLQAGAVGKIHFVLQSQKTALPVVLALSSHS